MPQILLVDDDPEAISWLTEFIRLEGYTVEAVDSLRAARIHLTRSRPEVILTDLMLPDGRGIELKDEFAPGEGPALVVITGHASLESAIEALRAGATDYLLKPLDIEQLRGILQRIPKVEHFRQEIGELRDELIRLGHFGLIIGNSPAMRRLYDQIARVAPTSASVLLIGESGTGKEVVAQTIHELSRRKREPFLPLNCGAVSPHLVESELFGHEKGSFTGADRQHHGYFERAHRGTLFLDEITEMRADLQVKLLRVLETGSFMRVGTNEATVTDVRLIAATNRSPEKAVEEGRLREDLYHRLNVFPIVLPPLRERGTDIELLAEHFLAELNEEEQTAKRFSPEAKAALYAHSWPGNVRELKNYVHRAFILADKVIEVEHAPDNLLQSAHEPVLRIRIGTPLDEVNRRVIEGTLIECDNVKRKAAEILGISLKTLYNRLNVYSGKVDDEGQASLDAAGGDDEAGDDPRRGRIREGAATAEGNRERRLPSEGFNPTEDDAMKTPPRNEPDPRPLTSPEGKDTNVSTPPSEDERLLPHERDESPDPPESTAGGANVIGPRDVVEQAEQDIRRGLRDTERRGTPSDVPGPDSNRPGASKGSVPEEGGDEPPRSPRPKSSSDVGGR